MSDNNNSIQKRTFTAIRAEFSGIAFRRGKDNIGGFVLQGIPEKIFQDICSRLFMLKCKLINHYRADLTSLQSSSKVPIPLQGNRYELFEPPY
jgi:hypothetical protein